MDSPCTETLEMLRRLVAFDTTSRDSNLGLIEWARDLLARRGIASRLTWNGARAKANLFATVGEGREGGLVLSGHTDVVPVDGQPWNTDPFTAVVRDGRMYGRGTCDMKAFIACVLARLPAIERAAARAPVHFAFTYDEEVGCRGVRELLADLDAAGIRPAGCIVGEPTQMGVVIAHKGRREVRCEVQGREAHSSMPTLGVNAIEYAAEVVTRVRRLARDEAAHGERDERFDLPSSTLVCTLTHGGIAPNVVPRRCEVTLDMRYLPSGRALRLFEQLERHVAETLLPEMREQAPDAGIRWRTINDTPGLDMRPDHPFVAWAMRHAGVREAGMLALGTEAGLFQRAGIPTVVCGPGNIEQAHKPDEFVALSQLAACERFIDSVCEEAGWPRTVHPT